jgi:hypothetical protein
MARRVVARPEFHAGELFPRVGFIVTNLETDSRAVVRFYNKLGTAKQWIKEDETGDGKVFKEGGEESIFDFEILLWPSEKTRTQKRGWSISC